MTGQRDDSGAQARRRTSLTALGSLALAIGLGGATAATAATVATAASDDWPNRPIRVVVGFPAGSTTDLVARVAAEHLRQTLGQPVIVENKPGANGLIGGGEVARAEPDGYTLLVTNSSSVTINPQLYRKAPYSTADLAPVTMLVQAPFILVVSPASARTGKVRTVAELIETARAEPERVSYGSAGPGNIAHLSFAMLSTRAGVKTTHIPYKSASGAQLALIGGEIDAFLDTPHGLPHIQAGKSRPLAVTSRQRLPELPEVPTMEEAGFADFDVTFWLAMLAPAKTPPARIARLAESLREIQRKPDVRKQLEAHGRPVLSTPAEFASVIRQESEDWGAVIRRENIQLD